MAFQPVPDTVEGTIVYQFASNLFWINTYYFWRTGGYSQAQVDTLVAALDGWGGIQGRAQIALVTNYHHAEVRGLANENDFFASANAGFAPGLLNSPVLPLNVALAIKRLSGLTGRSARGRIFWGGLTEADVTANAVDQARVDAIIAAQENMDTAVGILGWTPVIVSRFNAGVQRAAGVTFPIVEWTATDNRVDTMRKRLN